MRIYIIVTLIILFFVIVFFFRLDPKPEIDKSSISFTVPVADTDATTDLDGDGLPKWLEDIVGTEEGKKDDDITKEAILDTVNIKLPNSEKSPTIFYREFIAQTGAQILAAQSDGVITDEEIENLYNTLNEKLLALPLEGFNEDVVVVANTEANNKQFVIDLEASLGVVFQNIAFEKDYRKHAEMIKLLSTVLDKVKPTSTHVENFKLIRRYVEFMARLEEESPGSIINNNPLVIISLTNIYRILQEIKNTGVRI